MFTLSRNLFLVLFLFSSFLYFFSVDSKPVEDSSLEIEDSDGYTNHIENEKEISNALALEQNMNSNVGILSQYLKREGKREKNKPKKYKFVIKIVVCISRIEVF